jgi:hypothetical protein
MLHFCIAGFVGHELWPWVVLHSSAYYTTEGHSSCPTKLAVSAHFSEQTANKLGFDQLQVDKSCGQMCPFTQVICRSILSVFYKIPGNNDTFYHYYTSTPPYVCMAWCLSTKDNFTFTLRKNVTCFRYLCYRNIHSTFFYFLFCV